MMKNKENKFRFGIIDVAIILAVCALLVGVFVRYGLTDSWGGGGELKEYSVSFIILDKHPDSVDDLTQLPDVYYKDSGAYFGTLEAGVSIMPAEDFVAMPDGTIVKTTSSAGRVDVRGSVKVKGRYKEGEGFFHGGTTFIAPGGKMEMYTANADFTMIILDITESVN